VLCRASSAKKGDVSSITAASASLICPTWAGQLAAISASSLLAWRRLRGCPLGTPGVLTLGAIEGSPNLIRNVRTAPMWKTAPSPPRLVVAGAVFFC
jgi:hypothetical protein